MSINKFDARYKNWTLNSEYQLNDERIKTYNTILKEISNKNLLNCEIDIKQRIGMESTMGEVFKISFSKDNDLLQIAAKILPIINDSSFKNNEKEIRFAVEASELVLKNKSVYFPIVYDFKQCSETHFYEENISSTSNKIKSYNLRFGVNTFMLKSLRYQQMRVLLNLNVESDIKEKILKLKKNLLDPNTIVEKLNLNVKLPDKIQSHILFSELACFDLNYYIDFLFQKNELNFKILHYLLLHIFLAIKDMIVELNLLHNDLHLGNILLINDTSSEIGYLPLIHDFGKSRKLKYNELGELEHFDKEHDIFFFLGKLEDKINDLYIDIEDVKNIGITKDFYIFKSSLSEVIDTFYESKKIYPILDIIKYWKNLIF